MSGRKSAGSPKDLKGTKGFRRSARTTGCPRPMISKRFSKNTQREADGKSSSTATWGRSLPTICIGLMRIGSSIRKDVPDSAGGGRGLHSLRGKNNATEVVWKHKERSVRYGKRLYRAVIDPKDRYVREALADPADPSKPRRVRYCCLVRKRIRGKERFYVHLVLDGVPPARTIAAPK